jgi:hypothetical protein
MTRFPTVTLYCLHCNTRLRSLAMDDQLEDGRILCSLCRRAEVSRLEEPGVSGETCSWWEIAALVGIMGVAWAFFRFI